MTKSEEIIGLFQSTSGWFSDHWQRSALGIADSFARGGHFELGPEVRNEAGLPKDRDTLAGDIIAIIQDLDKEESYKARHDARDWLDAPFQNDPDLLAWRATRAAKGGIGVKSE